MHGRDLGLDLKGKDSPVQTYLKAHKALPKHRFSTSEIGQFASDTSSYITAERIKSWIPDPTTTPPIRRLDESIIPPIIEDGSYKSWHVDDRLKKIGASLESDSNSDANVHQRIGQHTEDPALKSKRASIVTQNTADQSRSDSFRTANEHLHQREDEEDVATHTHIPYRDKWSNREMSVDSKTVGLGLGLESDDERTPTVATPKAHKDDGEFITFNGVWGGETPHRIHTQLQHRGVKGAVNDTPLVDHASDSASPTTVHRTSVNRNGTSCTPPESLLYEKLEESSTLDFGKQLEQGLREEELKKLEAEVQDMDQKRHSQASTNSTVVAMVVDSPPRRRQTLRHTGRIVDSSKAEGLTVSVNSSPSLRRRDKRSHIPAVDLRKSFATDASVKKAEKVQPTNSLVVIPDRRGSLQSSSSSSKRLSKTFSTSSRQPSSRPTTAPEEAPSNYFEAPRPHRRSVSIVIQQARPAKQDDKAVQDLLSPIQQASSHPSTELSKEPSRTTSIASGGLKTQLLPATPPAQDVAETDNEDEVHEIRRGTLISDHRPQNEVVTPFSLRSAHSSTPGTLEVNEATALSIYPHTNKSILVIQEIASKDEEGTPREQSAIIASNASIAIPGLLSPVIHHEPSPSRQLTDSPLQNPREPPPPPELIKVIPPTPANAHASSDAIVAAGDAAKANRRTAPLSSIRRAFSARQHGESARTRTSLSRTFSLRPHSKGRDSTRRFSFSSNDDRDARLHPSWRPRYIRHHPSLSSTDSDPDFGNGVIYHPTPALVDPKGSKSKRTTSLSNRIANSIRAASLRRRGPRRAASVSYSSTPLPYEVVDDAIARRKPLARRLTNSLRRRPPRRNSYAFERTSPTSLPSPTESQFGRPPYLPPRPSNPHAGELEQVPKGGYGVLFKGWFERREEKEREKRRQKLRSNVLVLANGNDD